MRKWLIEDDLQREIIVVRGVSLLRYVSNHYVRHAADPSRTGLQRMQQPGEHLPGALRHWDGRGQSPSDDITRGLLPGDWNRSVKRVPGDDTIALMSRKHGFVVRSNKRRQVIFSKAAEVKYKDSSLRVETKGPDFITGLSQAEVFCWDSCVGGDTSRKGWRREF